MQRPILLFFLGVMASLWLGAGCASEGTVPAGGGGAGVGGATHQGASSSTGFVEGGGGEAGLGGGCVGDPYEAIPIPLDMFIMLDQSGSMLQDAGNQMSRWETVQAALSAFVSEPASEGIGLGIQYFGLPDPTVHGCGLIECTIDDDCAPSGCTLCNTSAGVCTSTFNPDIDSCDWTDYAWAEVPIETDNGNQIVANIASHSPGTNTPTHPALEGAIDYARRWKEDHPDHITIVTFATDGQPSECDTVIENLEAIAEAGFEGTPSVQTFVIGVGPALEDLDGVAEAGGTTTAYHVDLDVTATDQLLLALNTIRGVALACTYQVPEAPEGKVLDFDLVNVSYTPGDGTDMESFPKVAGASDCPEGGDGWFYDDADPPTTITLCPETCAKIQADIEARIDVVLGCATIVP